MKRRMPTICRAAALLLALALPGCGGEDAAPAAPPLRAPGQWLLLNYWAQWCKPCIEEIPELDAFARAHAGKVRVLLVNFDGATGEELAQQARTLGIPAELLLEHDPAPELGLATPQALPTTYVIGPDGKQRGMLQGPQTVASLEEAIGAP